MAKANTTDESPTELMEPQSSFTQNIRCPFTDTCNLETLADKLSPYIAVLMYFYYAEPLIKNQIKDERLQNGTKKLLECFIGVWFLDAVKDHAKAIKTFFAKSSEETSVA